MLGLERGGTAPKGWLAEDGVIPDWFRAGMRECSLAGYPPRTVQNIGDSDGTLILTRSGFLTGGTALTWRETGRLGKPRWAVAIGIRAGWSVEISKAKQWLEQNRIAILNVAGPRESKAPGIEALTTSFLCAMLAK